MICHLGPPWCDLLCGLGQGLEIYKIYLLVVIIKEWGCFAIQKIIHRSPDIKRRGQEDAPRTKGAEDKKERKGKKQSFPVLR